MEAFEDVGDLRPLFKRYMGHGWMTAKARRLRITRHTLGNILSRRSNNAKVLKECLDELQVEMEAQASALRRVHELTETHRVLQNRINESTKP